MDNALHEPWSVQRFLAWEDKQEARHEFDGARIIEMTGGSRAHQRIIGNLLRLLEDSLDAARFDVIQEMRIEVGGRIRYPDMAIVRAPVADDVKTLRDAIVLFEVLSDETAGTDLGVKKDEYLLLPSIRRYVLLEQNRMAAKVLRRGISEWRESLAVESIDIPEADVVLPLQSIYRGVRLSSR